MQGYKHYSFDLWMTLIKSNPLFKIERSQFFFINFNTKKKSLEAVALIFRQVDLMCNALNEKTGKNIDSDEMYLMVISMINDFENHFNKIDLVDLNKQMDNLFFNYMPTFYNDETIISLDKLKQQTNGTFNISSNTGFVKGSNLKKVLMHLKIADYFDFQIYSDEIGLSKPDIDFFNLMIDKTKNLPVNKNILLNEIVHIGDNINADIAGAALAGIKSIQINSNNLTISSLLK